MATRWSKLNKEERDKYINQDYVIQQELAVDTIDEWCDADKAFTNFIDYIDPNNLERIVILLFLDGKSVTDIAYHVLYSKQHIRRLIKRFKEKTNMQ